MRKPVLQKGQALLIILLILAVGATLVLSLVSRTVTEVAITTKEQESSRAFSAAEAGIEEALLDARTGSFTGSLTGESYSVTVNALSGGTEYAPAQKLFAGDTFPLWFVSHADDGSLTCNGNQCFTGSAIEMCWGEQGIDANSATSPAIELVVFYASTPGRYETVKIARAALDPNASRRASNGFAAPDPGNCTVASKQYAFQKRINFADLGIPASSYGAQNGLQLARIRFIYNDDRAHGVGIKVGTAIADAQTETQPVVKKIWFVSYLGQLIQKYLPKMVVYAQCLPSAPTNLSPDSTTLSSLSATFSWSGGTQCGGNAMYDVFLRKNDGPYNLIAFRMVGTSFFYSLLESDYASNFYWYVRQSNGMQSSTASFTTSSAPSPASLLGSGLPSQGRLIESTGATQEATRKIRVFKLWPDLPPIFDFAVFSTTGLVK